MNLSPTTGPLVGTRISKMPPGTVGAVSNFLTERTEEKLLITSPPKQDEEQQLLADATLLTPAQRIFPDLCAYV